MHFMNIWYSLFQELSSGELNFPSILVMEGMLQSKIDRPDMMCISLALFSSRNLYISCFLSLFISLLNSISWNLVLWAYRGLYLFTNFRIFLPANLPHLTVNMVLCDNLSTCSNEHRIMAGSFNVYEDNAALCSTYYIVSRKIFQQNHRLRGLGAGKLDNSIII